MVMGLIPETPHLVPLTTRQQAHECFGGHLTLDNLGGLRRLFRPRNFER